MVTVVDHRDPVNADKALALVEKLIRIAADGSGATEHERSNAAMRACSLIAEHGFAIRSKEDRPTSRTRARRPPVNDMVNAIVDAFVTRATAATPYRPSIAAEDCQCGEESCTAPIFRGERVWRRMKNGEVEYVHADCWIE